jgi:hypothetical protein
MTAPYCPDLRRSIDEHRGRPGRPRTAVSDRCGGLKVMPRTGRCPRRPGLRLAAAVRSRGARRWPVSSYRAAPATQAATM